MTTFSNVVEEVVLQEFNRPHLRIVAASYLNQTIRDVHFKKNSRAAVLFGENRVETELVVTELPVVWQLPSVTRFQQIEAVYLKDCDRYLQPRNPANALVWGDNPDERFYFYRSGATFVMNGAEVGQTLAISYFQYPRHLRYFLANQGPATWNSDTESFDTEDQALIDQVTNWLILRHTEALKEGVRAKLYRRMDNEIQARMAWSEFEDVRNVIHQSEGV